MKALKQTTIQTTIMVKVYFPAILLSVFLFSANALALRAEIKQHLGSPAIFINNKPCIPMVFMGRSSWCVPTDFTDNIKETWQKPLAEQVKLAAKTGIHFIQVDLRMPWKKPNEQRDYSSVDSIFQVILNANPDAYIFPRFILEAPVWWLEQHPDQRMASSDGQQGIMASIASELWRQEAMENIRHLIRHCEQTYPEHVIGYHACTQTTNEWFYIRSHEPVHSGFEEPMREGFARWAWAKYKTQEQLRKNWKQNDITFESIQVPTVKQRETAFCGLFRDPVRERFVIDFYEYLQVAMVETMEQVARLIKEETDGRKLVVFFYGYTFELSAVPFGPQVTGHYALGRLLQCPDVDILASPISYIGRDVGGIGGFMSPVDSIRDAGKLRLNEDDTRTWLCPSDSWAAGTDLINFMIPIDTHQKTLSIHKRNVAQLIPRRLGCWFIDLTGEGWLNSPILWDNIGTLRKIYEQQFAVPAQWQPSVAVIVDERSSRYLADTNVLTEPICSNLRREFYRLGTDFRMNLLSDVLEDRMTLPPVTFFVGCWYLTAEEREKIHKLLEGKTAVWFCGSGYVSEDSASEQNMTSLTGFQFRQKQRDATQITFENNYTWNGNLSGLTLNSRGNVASSILPLWAVQAETPVKSLARFADGSTAIATRNMKSWKSIYIGSTFCPARFLRNLLKIAGVHVYLDSDDVVSTDGEFLAIMASNAGIKNIHVPDGKALYSIETEELLLPVNGLVSQYFNVGQVRYYRIVRM
jgi:hypothetical protein